MENKIIIVSDVHGRTFWKKVKEYKDLPIVFLGDYTDPYMFEFEELEPEDVLRNTIDNLKEIIEFAKANPDRVFLLLGNHVLHYIGLSDDTCRMDWDNRKEIYNILKENESLFKHAFKWNDTLFTHAGVTNGWLEQSGYTTDPDKIADELNEDIVFTDEYLMNPSWMGIGSQQDPRGECGRSRGGFAPYGSPAWADITEMVANPAFEGQLIQIFGHTQLKKTGSFIHQKNWYCCDSRACFIWDGNELKVL